MLLNVQNLATHFTLDEGTLYAVNGINFSVEEQESVALVGESGCGKTIVALSLINLISPPARIVSGEVLFRGNDLLRLPPEQLNSIRGRDIGFIFQEPGQALNPVFPVGRQLVECITRHTSMTRHEAQRKAVSLIGEVEIPEPEERMRAYPHELSGGMKQRIVIALALCADPRLLIADEPTTALDVTVQAEILKLLKHLQDRKKLAMLLISHDLAVIANMASRVMVMYTGKIVEEADTKTIFTDPAHPYTRGLIGSIPGYKLHDERYEEGIPGTVPDLLDLPPGCTFHPRCEIAVEACRKSFPETRTVDTGHRCACIKARGYGDV